MLNKLLKNNKTACLTAVVCTLLWGTAFPFIKLGYSAFEIAENDIGAKLLFAGLRFTLAGIMVLAVVSIRGKRLCLPKKSDIVPIAVLGLAQTFAQYFFTYIGLGFTSGKNTSIITACASFFAVLFAPLFFKNDRLSFLKILGCAFGFGGVLFISGGGGVSRDSLLGDGLILCSTIAATAGMFISKKISRERNPFFVTGWQLLIGGVLLIISGLICGGKLRFLSLKCVLILLWLAFVSAAAFALWTGLLKYHPASKISVFNLLVPVFGTVLSGVILGEDVFNLSTLLSLLLISAGIAAVNMSGNFKPKKRGKDDEN